MSERVMSGSVWDDEVALEYEAVDEGVKRYRELVKSAAERGEAALLKPVERLLVHWFAPVRKAVAAEVREIRAGKPGPQRAFYGPILHLIDPSVSAVVAIREMLSLCIQGETKASVVRIGYAIGNALIAELHLQLIKEDRAKKEEFEKVARRIRHLNPYKINKFSRANLPEHFWSVRVSTKLGIRLMWSVIDQAVVPTEDGDKAAFLYRRKRKYAAEIHLSDHALKVIADGHATRQLMRPRFLPMLCPPMAWTFDEGGSLIEGGYIKIRTPLMSRPSKAQKDAITKYKPVRALNAVNTLGSTGFKINSRVLAVMDDLWARGGNQLDLPRAEDIPLPPRPDDFATNAEAKEAWKIEAAKVHGENRRVIGDRITFLSTMDVARRVEHRDAFYLPQQMDFRGRTYPIPLYLSHTAGDITRSLFQFARAVKADSPSGQGWLHVHAANCFGVDKVSFEDRIKWVHENASEIDRACQDPVGDEWWKQAKKPFQFLAACFALNDDREAAHLPIQVDGTANGLQWYAALGRDPDCGYEVNLVDRPTPGDPYAKVAIASRPMLEEDSARGLTMAQTILPHMNRDLAKPNVMTKLYNVTVYGASHQLHEKLRGMGFEGRELYSAARYLSRIILSGVAGAFPAAMRMMQWIESAARAIVRKYPRACIEWTSPIGLRVIQPYRRSKVVQVYASDHRVSVWAPQDDDPAQQGKQIRGAPPNLIHSLDASHKMSTALACRKDGVDFADVHDNYWSHAGTMDHLATTLRREFVSINAADPLADIRAQWVAAYPKANIPELPDRGSLDISDVLTARYFFS